MRMHLMVLVLAPLLLARIDALPDASQSAIGGSTTTTDHVVVQCSDEVRCYNGGFCARAEKGGEWRCDCSKSSSLISGKYCEEDNAAAGVSRTVDEKRRLFVKPPSQGIPSPPSQGTPAPSPRATLEDSVFVPPSASSPPASSEAPAAPSAPTAAIPLPPSAGPPTASAPFVAPTGGAVTAPSVAPAAPVEEAPSSLPTFEAAPPAPGGIIPLESDAPSDVPSMNPTGFAPPNVAPSPTVEAPTSVLVPTAGPPTPADGGGGDGAPTNRTTSGSTKSRTVAATSSLVLVGTLGAIGALLC